MDIFESLENLNVSEECFDEIMGIVEDLIDVTQNNLKDAKNKYDKYVGRIRKALMFKKENGTLDDATINKGLRKVMDSKYTKKVEKARDLADKAEKLHRATHNYPDGYYYERKHKDK
jgi:hypothetical protein